MQPPRAVCEFPGRGRRGWRAATAGHDQRRRLGFDDDHRVAPLLPRPREADPAQAINARQPEPASLRPFQHMELMP